MLYLLPCYPSHSVFCCSSVSNRLLGSKDHASAQINVGHVDKFGIYEEKYTVFCLAGSIRRQGEADTGLNKCCVDAGLMSARITK